MPPKSTPKAKRSPSPARTRAGRPSSPHRQQGSASRQPANVRSPSPKPRSASPRPRRRASAASSSTPSSSSRKQGGGEAKAGARSKRGARDRDAYYIVTAVLMASTLLLFTLQTPAQGSSTPKASSPSSSSSVYMMGLLYASLALIGNAAVTAFRKLLSQHDVGSAQQVGVACLLQGVAAVVHCVVSGDIPLDPASHYMPVLPDSRFWVFAAGASALLSLVKMLETRALAESDISLCTPFLAFDPVMQFLVGVAFMPITCSAVGLGCEDASHSYPLHHLTALVCIAFGAFKLGSAGGGGGGKGMAAKTKYFGPLPVGSWLILCNCVIYGFTSRMDRVAIASSTKEIYYAYGRLLMAATALTSAYAGGGLTWVHLKKLATPACLMLLLCICASDALYQLSQYQAMSRISPVYVTAIKRGGGILVSAVMGVAVFGESLVGRAAPIVTIVFGVTFLCL